MFLNNFDNTLLLSFLNISIEYSFDIDNSTKNKPTMYDMIVVLGFLIWDEVTYGKIKQFCSFAYVAI